MPRGKLSDAKPMGMAKLSDVQADSDTSTPPTVTDEIKKLTAIEPFGARPGILGHAATAMGNVGAGLMYPIRAFDPELWPTSALESRLSGAYGPKLQPTPVSSDREIIQGIARNPAGFAEGMTGGISLLGTGALRDAAMGDADAQALKALRISPASTKALRMLDATEGARPFLKGTQSIEDAQTRIPAAKQEIWEPYQKAIEKYGSRPVKGPDGMTTIGELENERLQLSALNRGLKSGDPAALQLAEQKGMTQAQLLDREKAIQSALDPALESTGIKPADIRKAFGQVSQVGSRVLGRSTLNESAPSGIGRMLNIRLENPRSLIGEPMQGLRDLIAGRPLWSAAPSDVAIREAFRMGGPKPDFGTVSQRDPFLLPENATVREGEEPIGRMWPSGVDRSPVITSAPQEFPRLTSSSSAGDIQPMIGVKSSAPPEADPYFLKTRVQPNAFRQPEILPPVSGSVAPGEGVRVAPRGLLHEGASVPEPTTTMVYPPGSEFGSVDMGTYYPPGSRYRNLVPPDEGSLK